eukprot:TRINITY_DN3390_c0_g1_i2.p1 TRINITY_DN3390_c0_g1~~TRINITY_DN3390_c0_g1_i2.p1  ORF type:complete len:541 (-),score=145.72 TRINITY_DN3390_c0_g1_i2:156-1778(-)
MDENSFKEGVASIVYKIQCGEDVSIYKSSDVVEVPHLPFGEVDEQANESGPKTCVVGNDFDLYKMKKVVPILSPLVGMEVDEGKECGEEMERVELKAPVELKHVGEVKKQVEQAVRVEGTIMVEGKQNKVFGMECAEIGAEGLDGLFPVDQVEVLGLEEIGPRKCNVTDVGVNVDADGDLEVEGEGEVEVGEDVDEDVDSVVSVPYKDFMRGSGRMTDKGLGEPVDKNIGLGVGDALYNKYKISSEGDRLGSKVSRRVSTKGSELMKHMSPPKPKFINQGPSKIMPISTQSIHVLFSGNTPRKKKKLLGSKRISPRGRETGNTTGTLPIIQTPIVKSTSSMTTTSSSTSPTLGMSLMSSISTRSFMTTTATSTSTTTINTVTEVTEMTTPTRTNPMTPSRIQRLSPRHSCENHPAEEHRNDYDHNYRLPENSDPDDQLPQPFIPTGSYKTKKKQNHNDDDDDEAHKYKRHSQSDYNNLSPTSSSSHPSGNREDGCVISRTKDLSSSSLDTDDLVKEEMERIMANLQLDFELLSNTEDPFY